MSKETQPRILDVLHDGEASAIEVEAVLCMNRRTALCALRSLERKGLVREVKRVRVPTGAGKWLTPVFAMERTRKSA